MDNPYHSPSANLFGGQSVTGASGVSEATIQHLARTKGWVRLIAVLGFIAVGFMLLGAVGLLVTGSLALSGLADGERAVAVAGIPILLGVVYLIFAVLYFFPVLKLWKYGSRIGNLMATRRVEDLDAALNEQRGFWKFTGIMAIIGMVIMGLAVLATVATPMIGKAREKAREKARSQVERPQ